jgi:hypothetical protein
MATPRRSVAERFKALTGLEKAALIGGAAFLAVGIYAVATAAPGQGRGADEAYDPDNRLEAISQCEDLVGQQLKSPTSADFNSTATGPGTWTVTGTVDAENSFGATVRAEYQCTVTVVGERITRKIDFFEG